MSDKQIIINGVNVAECEYFNRFRNICHNRNLCCDCDKNQDCQYKQLERKEQECEELKAEIKHYKQIAQYHGNLSVKYTNKSAKLKQTLAEIKEIMKKHCRKCKKHKFYNFKLCCTCKYTDILQKISECEVEDAR